MKITSKTFIDMGKMPVECVFGVSKADGKYDWGGNQNPHLAWQDLPLATKSLVLISDDIDVPANLGDYNKEGTIVGQEAARQTLCHWVLIDIDPARRELLQSEFSRKVTEGGKPGPDALDGTRQGINAYTTWFKEAPMQGIYFGYDGPMPPANDLRPHRYEFIFYALDIRRLPVEGVFDKKEVLTAMEGHVLASAKITGIFSVNPKLA